MSVVRRVRPSSRALVPGTHRSTRSSVQGLVCEAPRCSHAAPAFAARWVPGTRARDDGCALATAARSHNYAEIKCLRSAAQEAAVVAIAISDMAAAEGSPCAIVELV